MANCSFISATEARNLARNHTLLWTEICEVQQAVLTAIDANLYSVIVNDGTPFTSIQSILSADVTAGGTNYDLVSATAVINANGTAGINGAVTPIVAAGGTTITGFTVDTPGTGYTPIDVSAVIGNLYELNDTQDETDYTGGSPNGTFTGGDNYRVGEVISLSEASTATIDSISGTGVVSVEAQTDADFDGIGSNGVFVGGDGAGGTEYQTGTTITMSDGTVINVTSVDGNGDVDGFTISSQTSTSRFVSLATLTQVATTSTGVGFTITTDTNNEIAVGLVLTFDVASPGVTPFSWPSTVTQSTTDGIGAGFTLVPDSNNVAIVSTGINAVLTVIQASGAITNVVINSPGTGYLIGTPITFTGTNGTGATAIITAVNGGGGITAISVTNSGSGYEQAVATVTVTAPGGLTPAVEFAGTVTTTTASSSNNYASLAFDSANPYLITRTGGTAFNGVGGDGFAVGQKIIISNAEDSENDGTYTISAVTATEITVTEVITTTNATDTTALINHTAVIAGVAIIEGGSGYTDLYPTVGITDATGTGAIITTNIAGGAVTALNVTSGGSGYTAPTLTIIAALTSSGSGATGTATIGTNTFNTVPSDYNDVLTGQSTDPVIADQIQYVLDYFTALGYNIRAQTNSATANTMQWQIIW